MFFHGTDAQNYWGRRSGSRKIDQEFDDHNDAQQLYRSSSAQGASTIMGFTPNSKPNYSLQRGSSGVSIGICSTGRTVHAFALDRDEDPRGVIDGKLLSW